MISYRNFISQDTYEYPDVFTVKYWIECFLKSEQYYIRTYVKYLRMEEYYTFIAPNKLLKYWYKRKKNILGSRLGFFIHAGNFKAGLSIQHYGSIIVHPEARIGKNCIIHGNCCIGSNGGYPDVPPIIGNNVDIGQAAQILGGISIADNVKVGAGAIVVKSVLEEGVTVVGIRAGVLNK